MKLQTRGIRAPHQGREVVDQNVLNVATACAPGNGKSLNPFGRKTRTLLLVENLAVDPVGKPLQSHGPVVKMRKQIFGYADVVINNLTFSETGLRVEYLIEIGDRNTAALNFQVAAGLLARTH